MNERALEDIGLRRMNQRALEDIGGSLLVAGIWLCCAGLATIKHARKQRPTETEAPEGGTGQVSD